jgi:transposase-like protein/IS1 family transposase
MVKELVFMKEQELERDLLCCPYCGEGQRLGMHNRAERLWKCHACRKTFSETKGTVFEQLQYPIWVVILVLKLLAFGCPPCAIVAAMSIDERTVQSWQQKAGAKGKQVQERLVCAGQVELGHVQADELCVKTQQGQVWMATAESVFSRLWLWGEVSTHRDQPLTERLLDKVRQAASSYLDPLLMAVDGFAAYPKTILHLFHTKEHTGRPGRPKHVPWPKLNIVQVIKSYQGRKLAHVGRRLKHGTWPQVYALIGVAQLDGGQVNTAFIERLNATFRARLPSLVRRTRSLAATTQRLEAEMFWAGAVYNFCTLHASVHGTPAMAAGLTDHLCSLEELLRFAAPTRTLPVPV